MMSTNASTSSEIVPFNSAKYLARKKIFAFLGQKFHIFRPNGHLEAYVEQKALKLREDITVFRDEQKQEPLLRIKARNIIDVSATYDVLTNDGVKIGALQRKGLKSILRDTWLILDDNDQEIGSIEEDSMLLAMIRRFLSNLVPQTFNVALAGQPVAQFKQHFNPFVAKYEIDFSLDTQQALDRRLGMAAVVLLLAIEGRQN